MKFQFRSEMIPLRFLSRLFRGFSIALLILSVPLFSSLFYLEHSLPDLYYSPEESFDFRAHPYLTTRTAVNANPTATLPDSAHTVSIQLFDLIPIKTATVQTSDERLLVPCGTPFGIKMFTKGVLIVSLSDLQTESGTVSPAKDAGLSPGDVILTIDGQAVSTNEEVSAIISNCKGSDLTVTYRRDDTTSTTRIQPVKSLAGSAYRAGIWVRDSTAGIGTLTYYDPYSGDFGGLGHGICDVDTGTLMPLSDGEIVPVAISDVIPGRSGSPGELRGVFSQTVQLGRLTANTENGVFGQMTRSPSPSGMIPVCYRQQVQPGPAQILTTVEGSSPQLYDIIIEKVHFDENNPTKNMVIRITDANLLTVTGGIVQGMSGSPIIQDGKLVGAVTHVLVNDPTRGYGIFLENMLDAAG